MTRNLLIVALLVVVGIGVWFVMDRRDPGTRFFDDVPYRALYEEALLPVTPEQHGEAWPDDDALAALRSEWHAMGTRDSTVLEELARDWYYPAGQNPLRLTNASQTPTGRGLGFRDRLALGQQLREHPRWRVGTARFYPALSLVLSGTEKSILALLAGSPGEPLTTAQIAAALKLPEAAIATILTDLAAVAWVTAVGEEGVMAWELTDPAIAEGGALEYVTYTPAQGRALDLVSLEAALTRMGADKLQGSLTLSGPCSATGQPVSMKLVGGKLRSGRPGNAWAAVVTPPGNSAGLFHSEAAFVAWKAEHPRANVGVSGSLVEVYRTLTTASP